MKYYCRPFDPDEDRQIIENLWQRNLPKVPDLRFDWLYKDSYPATNVFSWLLFKGDSPCGSISIFTRDFKLEDEVISCGTFIDIIVDKSHRTLFPALSLVRAAVEGAQALGLDFLWAFPNEKAHPVFSRCGFKEIFQPARWSRIISFNSKIDPYVHNPVLKKFISKIVSVGTTSVLSLMNVSFSKNVDVVFHFLPGLSRYISCINNYLQPTLKDSFIQWRYEKNPIRTYRYYSVRTSSGEVSIAYFIDSMIAIIDAIYYSNVKLISIALHRFAGYLSELNMDAISLGATDIHLLNSQLKKAGFIRRYSDRKLLGVELSAKGLFDAIDSHIFMFDGDMDI